MRMEYPKGLRAALLAFGFDEKEATLYLAGLEIGSGGVLELARRTGLARTTIYPIVEQLRRRGFFRRKTIKGHPHYVAEPPHALLERFEERQRAFAEILPDLQMLHASARDAVGVTVYEGSEGFKQFWRNVIASGVREYCLLTSGKNMLEYVHQPYLVDRIIGNRVKAKVVKNKVAAPFRNCEFDIMYNEGISVSGDTLDAAVLYKVVNKAGNSYSYNGEKLGVGRETTKAFLRNNPKLMKEVTKTVWEVVEKGEAPDEEAADQEGGDEVPPPVTE